MRYDDEHLGELLRVLPPAPDHVVAAAKELFAHFSEQPEDAAPGDESQGHDDLPADDPMTMHDQESDSLDGLDDGDEPDGADWN